MSEIKDEFIYKIINVDGLFMGLNQRAVNYLLEHGEWYTLSDVENYGYDGVTGMLFACANSDDTDIRVETDIDGMEYVTGDLMACLYNNMALPTLVYDWFPTFELSKDGNIKFIPLYKYKLKQLSENSPDLWVYEDLDTLKSEIHKEMRLITLKTQDGEIIFPWTQNELEQSEMILEYNLGIY